jgi:hypothetical protein
MHSKTLKANRRGALSDAAPFPVLRSIVEVPFNLLFIELPQNQVETSGFVGKIL